MNALAEFELPAGASPPTAPKLAMSPLMTAASVLLDLVGVPRGTPAELLIAARGTLDGVHRSALTPVFSRSARVALPDCLLPAPAPGANRIDDEIGRIAAVPIDALVAELDDDGFRTAGWQLVARDPSRWREVYCHALERVWSAVQPAFERATPELDADLGQVPATLRGAARPVPALAPIARLGLGQHSFAPHCVFTPLIGGPRAGFVQVIDGAITYVAYPAAIRPSGRGPTRAPNRADLAQLLGEPRAQLLRRISCPTVVGELATALMLAPSVVSHHLTFLERAGLVRRERRGRFVFVRRTARADALIQIYAENQR